MTDPLSRTRTDALARGDIDEDAMRYYLIQDHRFVDAFVVLLASMVSPYISPTSPVYVAPHLFALSLAWHTGSWTHSLSHS